MKKALTNIIKVSVRAFWFLYKSSRGPLKIVFQELMGNQHKFDKSLNAGIIFAGEKGGATRFGPINLYITLLSKIEIFV